MATLVHSCTGAAPLDEELQDAFDRASREEATALVLVLPGDARVSRELVAPLLAGMQANPALTALALVHDSPTLSFVASSLALKLPGVRVRSASSVATTGL